MTVNSPTLTDRLARGIIDVIDDEGLHPGDPLPTVRELAARFEVTSPTIREALRRLQATDSITMRHGSGIYVGPSINRMLLPNPNGTRMTDERVLDLVEARLTVEPGIAALAATNRTDDQLTALKELAAKPISETNPSRVRTFHRELARASANPMLYEIIDSLLSVYGREQREVRKLIEDPERDLRQHGEILVAIRDSDPDAARDLTAAHLTDIRDEIRAQR